MQKDHGFHAILEVLCCSLLCSVPISSRRRPFRRLSVMARLWLLAFAQLVSGLVNGPWSDVSLGPVERARKLLKNMTLDEKLSMLHGNENGTCQCNYSARCAYVGNVAPVKRLGIPPINMQDGPQGFRESDERKGTSTAWPSGLTIAATWDESAAMEWGTGMGKEFYDKGANVQLGPGLNVARVPTNGRNFEYLSGEDPYLGYRMVQPVVKGIQSQKVLANGKHFILNNQEMGRVTVSAEADERTRFEMYYPPFEGAIEAGIASVMCSYNKINNVYSCENPTTLGELKHLGFHGFVMSDWGATHSMSIADGLDVEQAGEDFMNAVYIKAALASGAVQESTIDDAVQRILTALFAVGVMDEPASAWDWQKLHNNVTSASSVASARKLSSLGTVLLRNEGDILPLTKKKQIAVIGLADSKAIYHGGGSGSVEPSFVSTPLQGISKAAKAAGSTVVFDDGSCPKKAASLAAESDVTIVFVGTVSSEGHDRESLSLDTGVDWKNQNEVVDAIANKTSETVVVATTPGAILLPWSQKVKAILTNFMPGQQAGNAIADVLFGKVNPSGKLPLTFPNRENEMDFSQAQYPGLTDPNNPTYVFYTEKRVVGYRYYEEHNINFTTGFPFGHGLSYTSFQYSSLVIHSKSTGIDVSFKVQNSGHQPGAEVAQLYLLFPSQAQEPQQLKGFQKTSILKPGEMEEITMHLRPKDLSIWDTTNHDWKPIIGNFQVKIGSSSRDIRLTGSFGYSKEILV